MKVIKIEPLTGEWVTIEGGERYIRYSKENWSSLMGQSIEPIDDEVFLAELEKAYQEARHDSE